MKNGGVMIHEGEVLGGPFVPVLGWKYGLASTDTLVV